LSSNGWMGCEPPACRRHERFKPKKAKKKKKKKNPIKENLLLIFLCEWFELQEEEVEEELVDVANCVIMGPPVVDLRASLLRLITMVMAIHRARNTYTRVPPSFPLVRSVTSSLSVSEFVCRLIRAINQCNYQIINIYII